MSTDIADTAYEDEARCHAVDADGTRCPNPAEPASRFCGLPEHQTLEGTGSDHAVAPAAEVAEAEEVDEAPLDLVDAEPGRATGMAAEPGPYGGLDEGAEEQAAAEGAAAIGGVPEPGAVATPEEVASPAQQPVVEGGGEAADQEQVDDEVRRAVEEFDEADLTADGQGFDEPTREP